MLAKREASISVVISEKEEEKYQEWQTEAKKKSKKSWEADLTDLLLLDLFIDGSLFGMFDGDAATPNALRVSQAALSFASVFWKI